MEPDFAAYFAGVQLSRKELRDVQAAIATMRQRSMAALKLRTSFLFPVLFVDRAASWD